MSLNQYEYTHILTYDTLHKLEDAQKIIDIIDTKLMDDGGTISHSKVCKILEGTGEKKKRNICIWLISMNVSLWQLYYGIDEEKMKIRVESLS